MGAPKVTPDDVDPSQPLPDPRHEEFAQNLSDGMTQLAAYEAAGFVAQKSNACIMAKKPHISARVEWLTVRKAEEAGMTLAGKVVVDLDKVNAEAPKLSPEWFLYRVMVIAEGGDEDEGGAKPSDQLKALQMGADWMGYFKQAKNGPMKTKDPEDNGSEAGSKDRSRRVAAGRQGALSRFSSLVDGLGSEGEKPSPDRVEGTDQASRSGEAEEDIEQQ